MSGVRNHAMWMERYKQLQRFVDDCGHALVPRDYETPDGFKLGVWVSEQRRRKEHHSAKERALLEALPLWTFNGNLWRWLSGLREYRAYVANNGSLDVPADYETTSGLKLGLWLSTTRQQYANNALGDEPRAYLECIKGWQRFAKSGK